MEVTIPPKAIIGQMKSLTKSSLQSSPKCRNNPEVHTEVWMTQDSQAILRGKKSSTGAITINHVIWQSSDNK